MKLHLKNKERKYIQIHTMWILALLYLMLSKPSTTSDKNIIWFVFTPHLLITCTVIDLHLCWMLHPHSRLLYILLLCTWTRQKWKIHFFQIFQANGDCELHEILVHVYYTTFSWLSNWERRTHTVVFTNSRPTSWTWFTVLSLSNISVMFH